MVPRMAEGARLRIGELSRRVGVSPELLRAWETRYGLVAPERTAGGTRLYSREDERRVRVMLRQIATGLSAAEAARVALGVPGGPTSVPALLAELDQALRVLDEPRAQSALDRAFAALDLPDAIGEVVLPFLHELGERWARAERSVAQEHFASQVIGGRLRGLSRGWGRGNGPRALLACPSGEQHDLGLLCFGLLLRARGWRIAYLGTETPLDEVAASAAELHPELIVLCSVAPQPFLAAASGIRELSGRARVAIGGRGASAALAATLGVEMLDADLRGAVGAVA